MKEEFEKLEKLFHDVYLIVDEGVVKLLCAAVIANRLPIDPLWIFLVGPSGSGKTEFITSLNKVRGIEPISSLTPHTFISGLKRDQETSLLFKITKRQGPYGILTFKDFTGVLTIHHESRGEILGQLREIFDGALSKPFGTGEEVKWVGKIGMISGVTDAIYLARDLYASMGERFVMYKFKIPNRKLLASRSMDNVDTIRENREMLRDAMVKFLDTTIGIPDIKTVPKVPPSFMEEIRDLAELATRARSAVDRDWRSSSKLVTYIHDVEVPTRFPAQLMALTRALMVLNEGALTELDQKIIYKIAFDSISPPKRRALQEASRYVTITTQGLATLTNHPTSTTRMILEELNALELIYRIKGGRQDYWKIRNEYRELFQKFDKIELLDYELKDDVESPDSFTTSIIDELIPTDEITPEEVSSALEARANQEQLL